MLRVQLLRPNSTRKVSGNRAKHSSIMCLYMFYRPPHFLSVWQAVAPRWPRCGPASPQWNLISAAFKATSGDDHCCWVAALLLPRKTWEFPRIISWGRARGPVLPYGSGLVYPVSMLYLYIPVPNREEAANGPRHTTRQASVCLLLALFPGSSKPGLDVSF